ncbi:metal ABC transporter permease [Thermodesulfobacteriota bacterium]
MFDFITAFLDPDNGFLRLALYMGTLASLSFGVIGTYVITRRITFLAGSISHCVFGGIGAGLYIQKKIGIAWFDPIYGAVGSALLAAGIIGFVTLYARQREDTVIGALWAVGMAAGLIFIDLTPGYFDLSSYLFGDILLISSNDLWLVIGLDVIVLSLSAFFFNKFLAVCFDNEFASLRGINVGFFYTLLLCLIALTVVLLVRIVGVVMVIALLTLPAATAGHLTGRLIKMMLLAIIFCMAFIWSGLVFSYSLRLSSGPVIILIAGFTYLAVLTGARILKKP